MDPRDITAGYEIPSENYADQPYVVVTLDGNWLCVLTTGPSTESQQGQHVVATISADKGRTWSELIPIEPSLESDDWHMTSWVTALIVPSGRVYALYNYRYDDLCTQHGGWLCYRYSDDHGHTWSGQRYRVPMRMAKRDRENVTSGTHQFFWCIDKPVIANGSVFFGLPKLTTGVPLDGGEGWVVCSDNILTERAPEAIHWELLPDGDVGVWNPDLGSVQEEQNIEVLGEGSLYMVNRTEIGHPAYAVSRDGGHTWTTPQVMRYASGRRALKNPRACPRVWKASNGKFLFWFHNNGFPGWGNSAVRNPVWISGGIEVDGDIQWSQPEILLYAPDPTVRGMSYPDFIEQDGRYWVTETQKVTARVHEIDPALLEGLWTQYLKDVVVREGLAHESGALSAGDSFVMPALPSLRTGGFTLEMWLLVDDLSEGQRVVSSFGEQRRGFQVTATANGAIRVDLRDNWQRHWLEVVDGVEPQHNVRSVRQCNWTTEEGAIRGGKLHHVVVIVDGLANVVSVLVDGVLCDGGTPCIQGWWRLNPWLDDLNGDGICAVDGNLRGRIARLRIYDRHLRTSEAIANYNAGPP